MVELHLHLDGSFRPETIWKMYEEQNLPYPAQSIEDLKEFFCPKVKKFNDMHTGLRRFQIPIAVMQDEGSLERIAYELVEDLSKIGVRYAETRFAPQQHQRKGLTQDQTVKAVEKGLREGMKAFPSVRMGLLLCLMRGGSYEDNMETVDCLERTKDDVVCGLDLAGDEENYPAKLYSDQFTKAHELGLNFTMHAGEPAEKLSTENAWVSIRLGAKRLGHGTNVITDNALVEEIKRLGVTIECCLTSNVKSKHCNGYADHPIRKLFDAGVKVCLNSDNMVMAGTNNKRETELAKEYLHFTDEEIAKMEQMAYDARFLK